MLVWLHFVLNKLNIMHCRVQPMNGGVGGVGGGSTSAVMAVGDVDRDSVSSDSGRGPSEDEFRASSSLRSQHPPPPPVHRIHNGQRAHLL